MLLRFLLLLFFLSFSNCHLIKEIEEAKRRKEEEYRKLNIFAQSVHDKAKRIKAYIKETKEEGKEVIKVRPGLNEIRTKYSKCLSYIYKQASQFKIMEEHKAYYIRDCLKKYKVGLTMLEAYYYRGYLTSGLKEVLSKEQKARRIKEQQQEVYVAYEDVVCNGVKVSREELLEIVMKNSFERDWRYRRHAREIACRYKEGIYGKG